MAIPVNQPMLSVFYLKGQSKNIPLYKGLNVIRRQRMNHSQFMSREHCIIYVKHNDQNQVLIMLKDISANGTIINGRSIIKNAAVMLNVNDDIALGSHFLTFQLKRAVEITID